MRRKRRNGLLKERIVMAACAVLVLGSLTATGLWLRKSESSQEEDYVVDLSAIENNAATGFAPEGEIQIAENITQDAVTADDLDYDPYFQETNSGRVENPDQSESESMSDGVDQASAENVEQALVTDETESQIPESPALIKEQTDIIEEAPAAGEEEIEATDAQALSTAMQPALTFSDSDTLVWPVVGNVLVNYSMDKTVYFPTLQQYKYNPAIMIQANEGDLITAAAAGKVIDIFDDTQIGHAVTMELGGGYEVTYGQLTNILVSEGSYVAMGDIIGEVAAPTKYFSVEGTNV
ncbi:MAG: M23 family metallopeptidase, partial [Lachnospiraceae bacterium]|nr:M23 family metallopeptidase [Lachnospiraceae bacterium]